VSPGLIILSGTLTGKFFPELIILIRPSSVYYTQIDYTALNERMKAE
jgi:hypothetical protein